MVSLRFGWVIDSIRAASFPPLDWYLIQIKNWSYAALAYAVGMMDSGINAEFCNVA
jgi:hypothetical protein